jgi:hypothetical protein
MHTFAESSSQAMGSGGRRATELEGVGFTGAAMLGRLGSMVFRIELNGLAMLRLCEGTTGDAVPVDMSISMP